MNSLLATASFTTATSSPAGEENCWSALVSRVDAERRGETDDAGPCGWACGGQTRPRWGRLDVRCAVGAAGEPPHQLRPGETNLHCWLSFADGKPDPAVRREWQGSRSARRPLPPTGSRASGCRIAWWE